MGHKQPTTEPTSNLCKVDKSGGLIVMQKKGDDAEYKSTGNRGEPYLKPALAIPVVKFDFLDSDLGGFFGGFVCHRLSLRFTFHRCSSSSRVAPTSDDLTLRPTPRG